MAASGPAPLAPERSSTRVQVRAGPVSIHASYMQADTAHAQSVHAVHTTHAQLFASCHREPTSYLRQFVGVCVFCFLGHVAFVPGIRPGAMAEVPPGLSQVPQGRLVSCSSYAHTTLRPAHRGRPARTVTGCLRRAVSLEKRLRRSWHRGQPALDEPASCTRAHCASGECILPSCSSKQTPAIVGLPNG